MQLKGYKCDDASRESVRGLETLPATAGCLRYPSPVGRVDDVTRYGWVSPVPWPRGRVDDVTRYGWVSPIPCPVGKGG